MGKSEVYYLPGKVMPPGTDASYRTSSSLEENLSQKPLDVLCSVEGKG